MTYWADNIKFIKDILESKYKKLDDAISEVRSKTFFVSTDSLDSVKEIVSSLTAGGGGGRFFGSSSLVTCK